MKISAADTWFSKAVKLRDNNTCQKCGIQKERMECSHVHSRRHRTIRWDLMNAKTLCHGCHRWWHENPTESGKWFEETYGITHVEILLEKKNAYFKVPKSEEKEISKHYREECKKKESDPTYEIVSYQ